MPNWPQCCLRSSRSTSSTWSCRRARGTRWISIAGDPIIDTAGRFEGFRGVGSDITEMRQTQERLTHLANMDVLSGLPNRGRVRQLLGDALRAATASSTSLRDPVPRPRRLQAGQRHLRPPQGRRRAPRGRQAAGRRSRHRSATSAAWAATSSPSSSSTPRAAAWSSTRRPHHRGDRRAVHDRPDRNPHRRLDRLRVRPDRRRDASTISSSRPTSRSTRRRTPGRGIARYFSSDCSPSRKTASGSRTTCATAIAAKQFHLLFQPLVNAEDQKLIGFEALIRWNHPQRGIVPPNVFIPVAEETGLMRPDRRMGDRRGLPRRRHLARPDHRRDQHQPQADHPSRHCPTWSARHRPARRCPATGIELEVTEGIFLGDCGQRSTC